MPDLIRTPIRDHRDPAADAGLGTLPEWDLSDLYAGENAPELAHDLDWLGAECATFARDYEGKLADLDAEGLLGAIRRQERIGRRVGAGAADDARVGLESHLPEQGVAGGGRRLEPQGDRVDEEPEAVGQAEGLLHGAPDPRNGGPEREGGDLLVQLDELALQRPFRRRQDLLGHVDVRGGHLALIPLRVGQRLRVDGGLRPEFPLLVDPSRDPHGHPGARLLIPGAAGGADLRQDRRVVPPPPLVVQDGRQRDRPALEPDLERLAHDLEGDVEPIVAGHGQLLVDIADGVGHLGLEPGEPGGEVVPDRDFQP